MDPYFIPHDDLLDVMEMTHKIEECMQDTVEGHNRNLAISAICSASINAILSQCNTFEEVLFYRNLFVKILDSSIRSIQIKPSDE